MATYQSFIRPCLDYDNIIYGQVYDASFQRKVECIRHNAALVIAGAIHGTSEEKLFESWTCGLCAQVVVEKTLMLL